MGGACSADRQIKINAKFANWNGGGFEKSKLAGRSPLRRRMLAALYRPEQALRVTRG